MHASMRTNKPKMPKKLLLMKNSEQVGGVLIQEQKGPGGFVACSLSSRQLNFSEDRLSILPSVVTALLREPAMINQ